MISQKENYASYPGDLEKDQVKYTVQKIENFASYPGDLEEDQVKYIVHKIKDNYKKETGKYLPLAERFTNPKNSSQEIEKEVKIESEAKVNTDEKTEEGDKETKTESKIDEEEQKDDTKSNDIDLLSEQKDTLENQLELIQDNINNSMSMIDKKDKEITEKKVRGLMQKREILDKLNVVETRNRMLQLSEEKNIYKTKVINTAIAVILGGLTLSALFYVRRQKK